MTRVTANGRRYESLAHNERGEAMDPYALVADALRRLTDGSLTFRLAENEHSIVAAFALDGRRHTGMWSKALLGDDCEAADQGVRDMLRRASRQGSPS